MNIPSRLPDNPASELQMFKNETPDTSWTWGVTRLSTGHLIARCDTMQTADLLSSAPSLLAERDDLRAALNHVLSIYGDSLTENTRQQARAAIAKGVA